MDEQMLDSSATRADLTEAYFRHGAVPRLMTVGYRLGALAGRLFFTPDVKRSFVFKGYYSTRRDGSFDMAMLSFDIGRAYIALRLLSVRVPVGDDGRPAEVPADWIRFWRASEPTPTYACGTERWSLAMTPRAWRVDHAKQRDGSRVWRFGPFVLILVPRETGV